MGLLSMDGLPILDQPLVKASKLLNALCGYLKDLFLMT